MEYKESVARWFAKESNLRAFCAECAAMTDSNCHTERQIMIAHKFGFKAIERQLRNLDAVHTDMGYLCEDLVEWRRHLGVLVSNAIEHFYGKELAEAIANA
jgi:hypothetical protein